LYFVFSLSAAQNFSRQGTLADLLLSLVSKSVRVLSCTSVFFIYLFLLIVPAGFCGLSAA
jgi:hypothetical protein